MASPCQNGLPEPNDSQWYWQKRGSQASKQMMDQQNFEAPRPASADPLIAPALPTPGSVESLASELGLRLGDQKKLTIRRVKRGKSYSFVRADGRLIRDVGTIKRLRSMA